MKRLEKRRHAKEARGCGIGLARLPSGSFLRRHELQKLSAITCELGATKPPSAPLFSCHVARLAEEAVVFDRELRAEEGLERHSSGIAEYWKPGGATLEAARSACAAEPYVEQQLDAPIMDGCGRECSGEPVSRTHIADDTHTEGMAEDVRCAPLRT